MTRSTNESRQLCVKPPKAKRKMEHGIEVWRVKGRTDLELTQEEAQGWNMCRAAFSSTQGGNLDG